MSLLRLIFILLAAFLAVYCESSIEVFRNIFGAQVDLLPALMVYTSLTMGLPSIALLAVIGGLLFDSLSANALGISIVPLLLIGVAIHRFHGLLLRDQLYAQFAFGVAASLLTPLLTLLILLSGNSNPLVGWGTLWQLLVMGVGGGLLTPVCFWVLDSLNRALNYQPVSQSSFRPDRQIKRGRA
ncbi:MAG: hypothetical protein ABIP76_08775 [Verrucomicrobiota bacterium]